MSDSVIIIQSMNKLNRPQLIINYLRAVERFRYACNLNIDGRDNLYAESLGWEAIGESHYWLYSLFLKLESEKISFKYTDLMLAFRFVRDKAQHANWYPIATEIISHPDGQRNTWKWGELPTSQRQGDQGMDQYLNLLKGNQVLRSLELVGSEIFEIRKWQISKSAVNQPGYPNESKLPFDTL